MRDIFTNAKHSAVLMAICDDQAATGVRAGEASVDGVVHEDVFVEFLPTQGAALHTKGGFFQQLLRGVGEARVFGGGEADEALVGEFDADAAAFDPAA